MVLYNITTFTLLLLLLLTQIKITAFEIDVSNVAAHTAPKQGGPVSKMDASSSNKFLQMKLQNQQNQQKPKKELFSKLSEI